MLIFVWTLFQNGTDTSVNSSQVGGASNTHHTNEKDADADWEDLLGRYIDEEEEPEEVLGRGQRRKAKVKYFKDKKPSVAGD